ncbi:MAG: hypothetical protein ABIO37_16125 [Caulobacteraceae bacterium]
MLGYARRNHWQVAHVHRRRLETSTGKSDPELRPIEGLEPLPTERVYVRQINRPVTLRDDPFWRDTLSARGADILMVGHLTLQAIADVASTAQNVGLDVMMVEDAIWRRHPNTPFDGSALSLFALKRMQSAQVRQTSEYRQALSLHGPANTP